MKHIRFVLLMLILLLSYCNHARVRFPVNEKPKSITPPTSAIKIVPKECQGKLTTPKQKSDCEEAKKKVELAEQEIKKKQEEMENTPPKKVVLVQDFFIWGYYPKKITVDIQEACDRKGVIEVYQYGRIRDEVIGQLTLGMYMPRTLEITCQKY